MALRGERRGDETAAAAGRRGHGNGGRPPLGRPRAPAARAAPAGGGATRPSSATSSRSSPATTSSSTCSASCAGPRPSATGQLLDALLDPRQDPAVRRRIPRVLRRTTTQRAVDGLLLGLLRSAVRRAAPVRPHPGPHDEREPSLVVPRAAVFAAVVRDLEAAPRGWSEDQRRRGRGERRRRRRLRGRRSSAACPTCSRSSRWSSSASPCRSRTGRCAARTRPCAAPPSSTSRTSCPRTCGASLWPYIGTRPRPPAPSRTRQHLVQDLMRSSESLGLSQAMKRMPRR